jgi:uncharacterized repeat protein (TIGR02543 family)
MRNRGIFAVLVLISVVVNLFIACEDPNRSDSVPTYTVSFEANGGNPAPQSQTISRGGKVAEPYAIAKTYYGLEGWYKEAACTNKWDFVADTVSADITLYAKWYLPGIVPGELFYDKIAWLNTNAQDNGNYIFEFDTDQMVSPIIDDLSSEPNRIRLPNTVPPGGRISITLKGIESRRIIFRFWDYSYTQGSMFVVDSGIDLILDDNLELWGRGRILSNNSSLIRVKSNGSLTLNKGSKITNNFCSNDGGGVYVGSNGTFTMNDGEISGNRGHDHGGGVYVESGTFTMNGGIFTMNGGKISGNASNSGGGVYVGSNGTFTMNDGKISGNTSSSQGGGVYIHSSRSYFIYPSGGGIFNKTGGTIFGYSDGDNNSNYLSYFSGGYAIHTDHDDGINNYYRRKGKDSTSGPGDTLSFNSAVTPPTWSGEWDYEWDYQ